MCPRCLPQRLFPSSIANLLVQKHPGLGSSLCSPFHLRECVCGGAWSAYVLPRDKTCSTFSATKTTKLPTGPARITVEEKPSVVLRYTLPPCNPANKGLLVAVASHGPTQHSTDRGAGSRTPVFPSVVLSMYPPPRSCGRHLPSLVHSKAKQWSDLTDPRKRASYSGLVLGTLFSPIPKQKGAECGEKSLRKNKKSNRNSY